MPLKYFPRALAVLYRFGLVDIRRGSKRVQLEALLPQTLKPPRNRNPRKTIQRSTRLRIYELDGGLCGITGAPVALDHAAFDHIIPFAYGGADHPANLVTACRDANAAKWDTLALSLRRYRGEQVDRPVGMRWRDGAFWPVINGRVRR